jgi:hypothetical protein
MIDEAAGGTSRTGPSDADDLLASVRTWRATGGPVRHAGLQRLVEEQAGRAPLPLSEWSEVVRLASDQLARWQTRWLFSPAANPDADAAAEVEGWRELHAACAEALLTRAPEVRERLERQDEVAALRHALKQRLDDTEGRTARRVLMALLSLAATVSRRMGLHPLAARLDAAALYPTGSVGRHMAARPPLSG